MRSVPDTFDAGVVAEIDRRLDDVETSDEVAVAWAIESGSRAWGFPSPDSDYDCRFLYVRSVEAYVSPWPARDVIETPLDKIFDVNGWDLRKAVQLLVKGNAVVIEWLRSPFVYRGQQDFRTELLALADEVTDRAIIGRHYLHVGAGQWSRYGGGGEVPLKRAFYALRPAATLRWLENHPDSAVAPMELVPLLVESDAPKDVIDLVRELVELKSRTREMGSGTVPKPLLTYVEQALEFGESYFREATPQTSGHARELGQAFFSSAVRTYGPDST